MKSRQGKSNIIVERLTFLVKEVGEVFFNGKYLTSDNIFSLSRIFVYISLLFTMVERVPLTLILLLLKVLSGETQLLFFLRMVSLEYFW